MSEVSTFELVRAGALAENPATIEQAARAFTAAAPDGSTLILLREEAGSGADARSFVSIPLPEREAVSVAFKLGTAVAGKAVLVPDGVSLVEAPKLAVLEYRQHGFGGQSTQQGAEFAATVRGMVRALMPGEWVAVSLRRPSGAESRGMARWLAHDNVTRHHATMAGAVSCSVWAGSDSGSRARANVEQFAALAPGWTVPIRGRSVSMGSEFPLPVVVPALLGVLMVLFTLIPVSVRGPLEDAIPGLSGVPLAPVGVAFSVAGVALSAWVLSGRSPWGVSKVRRLLSVGVVPRAPRRVGRVRPPHGERVIPARGDQPERYVKAFAGDYPLHVRGMLLGPQLPAALVAPHSGSSHGAAESADRLAVKPLREVIGPKIGDDAAGPVFLSAADLWAGVFATGLAGSGKSRILEALWGWMLSPAAGQVPDAPARRAMVAFDTKGDSKSAASYEEWGRRFGRRVVRADVAVRDTDLVGINFFPSPEDDPSMTAELYARNVVETLRFVYGEDAIGNRSAPSLVAVFEAGSVLSRRPELLIGRCEAWRGRSAFWFANAMIGNRDDQDGVELADCIFQGLQRDPNDVELQSSADRLTKIYGPGVSASNRRQLFDAPRSKVEPLMALEHWWTRVRQLTWRQVLENDLAVVVNTGTVDGHMLDDDTQRKLGAMAFHTLRHAIRQTCVGWEDQGRRIALFADEVKHLAEHSSEPIEWTRNDGRAFGVEALYATQFAEQLEQRMQQTLLGFGTRIVFRQEDEQVISKIVRSLNVSVSGAPWTSAEIAELPKYTAVIRTTLDKEAMPASIVKIPDFWSMSPDEFVAVSQGR